MAVISPQDKVRMKIAGLLPHMEVWGGVRRYLELGNELIRKGHNFIIYTPEGKPPVWLEFKGQTRPFSQLFKEQHDVAICSEYSLLPQFQALSSRVKFFYFVLAGHRWEKIVVRQPYRFLANSSGLSRRIEKRYRVRCEVAAGGINPDLFYPLVSDRPGNEFRVLCYGRLYRRRKGIQRVVRAVEKLHRKYPRVKLLLFDSPVEGEKRDPRELLQTSIPYEFFWNLPQTSLAWMYSQADIFVSAERRAGWSNPTAEAMACGVPVICTPSGTEDFAIPNQTAIVVRWPLPFILKREIEKIMRAEDLRRRLSLAGRQKILEFTWSSLADRLEKIFTAALV